MSGEVTVFPAHVEGLVAVRAEVTVSGRTAKLAASLEEARRTGREPSTRVTLGPGLQGYTATAEIRLEGHAPMTLSRRGAVIRRPDAWSRLGSGPARRAPVAAMRQLLDEVGRLAPEPDRPTLIAGEPPPPTATAEAERRIGARLPPTYLRMLAAFGPFVLMGTNDEGRPEPAATLHAP